MIEKPTVFLLGAGAHCSYNFPSGEKLKSEVADQVARAGSSDDSSMLHLPAYRLASHEEVQSRRCEAFAESLRGSGQLSIDAFLAANRHEIGFDILGKAGIAQVLIDYEKNAPKDSDDDWLKYLFGVMLEGVRTPEEFVKNNNLSFVTFNYDRYLESWLHQRIRHSFGICGGAALDLLNEIPIFHVYGSLGAYPDPNHHFSLKWIEATRSIRTIFDTEQDKACVDSAKAVLTDAEIICLLGFGYHQENIDLLGLDKIFDSTGTVCSSRYGLTDSEFQRLSRGLNSVQVTEEHLKHKCLQSIRNLPVF